MAKKRNSIQELIYALLGNKKTARRSDLVEHIEAELSDNADRSTKPKYAATRALKTLLERGDIDQFETEHSNFLRLTPQGKQRLETLKMDNASHPIPTTWDGKWRMVILNIPESDKERRNSLRYLLKKAQFVCVKNSVWVSPYPFEHFFENMKKDMSLNEELIIIVTDAIDDASKDYFRECFLGE